MSRTLIEACMDGAELHFPDPFQESRPVDFAVSGGGRSIIALPGWWETDYSTKEALLTFAQSEIERKDAKTWVLESPLAEPFTITTSLSDGEMVTRVRKTRQYADMNRDAHLFAITEIRDMYSGIDFTELLEAVAARPIFDPVADFRRTRLGLRKIGGIFLVNQDNERVDVLLLDEHGDAATAGGNGWLEAFGDRWSDMDPRPDVGEFLDWVATQRAYGPYALSPPQVLQKEGMLEDLAISMRV